MKSLNLVIFFLATWGVFAQTPNPLLEYQWRSHLCYNRAYSITENNNRIYCAVTVPDPGNDPYYKQVSQGVFYYDKSDNSFGELDKVDGLSDVDPLVIKSNPYNGAIFIGYANANIDLIKGDLIINVSDIKRKQIVGEKIINSVTFSGKYAYISTSLGIIVLDTDNGDVMDSYIIGPNGSYLNVYECALNNTSIYAATSAGLYYASLSTPNLSNFQSWTLEPSLPVGPYNTIVNFNGNIITNYSKYIQSGLTTLVQDTLYRLYNGAWQEYPYKAHDQFGYTIKKIVATDALNCIAFLDHYNVHLQDSSGNTLSAMWNYSSTMNINESDIVFESNVNSYWLADKTYGLMKCSVNQSSVQATQYERIFPNGPNTFLTNDVKIHNNKVIVAPNFLSDYPGNSYFQEGLYIYENDSWRQIKKHSGLYFDINCVAPDPDDDTHLFCGSYGAGVLEFRGDSCVATYDNTNSPLPLADFSSGTDTRTTSMEFDSDGNLWVLSAYSGKFLTARDKNGSWHGLNFSSSVTYITDQLIVDKNNQVWAITLTPGIMVYKNDGNFSQPNTSNSFFIATADADDKISASLIYCVAEDKEGDIWVGTNKGIFVLYNPESIISNQNYTSQQILVEEDGITEILFGSEDVSCIAVDGANNKWVGTRKNGVFCVSPDGQKELFHFTEENSPLFSDNIIEISVNPDNGEVFIGTDKGMISFQNTVIEGFEKFTNVYAYPNPVKPAYSGPVMIKGLVSGSSLKIMDVSGNLVYETTVEGGQAVWQAKNFKGERVASGVYLVMCATTDGSQKAVCKILVIN